MRGQRSPSRSQIRFLSGERFKHGRQEHVAPRHRCHRRAGRSRRAGSRHARPPLALCGLPLRSVLATPSPTASRNSSQRWNVCSKLSAPHSKIARSSSSSTRFSAAPTRKIAESLPSLFCARCLTREPSARSPPTIRRSSIASTSQLCAVSMCTWEAEVRGIRSTSTIALSRDAISRAMRRRSPDCLALKKRLNLLDVIHYVPYSV